eukprot:TRINITY_DN9021_c0_g1_i1.p1 TRINITY_DN9021_c0_g1~~TRINITY_DN9021_c0_g1_i1.p1  ORF type:complete len:186 (+),score=25.06 TRINITY_DN9021_c0_g1_i1:89-646(+)
MDALEYAKKIISGNGKTAGNASSSGAGSNQNDSADAPCACLDLSYTQRMAMFAVCLVLGLVCLFLSSYMVFGLLTGNSNKFALMYTLANILLLGSTSFLVGFKRQLANMFSESRMHASLAYLISLSLTVYCGVNLPYWFTMFPLLIIQFISMLWYIYSYLPWGRGTISFFSRRVGSSMGRSVLPL